MEGWSSDRVLTPSSVEMPPEIAAQILDPALRCRNGAHDWEIVLLVGREDPKWLSCKRCGRMCEVLLAPV